MKSLLLDPRLFNYIIITLYTINATQYMTRAAWLWDAVMFANSCYWLAALSITAVVTFLPLR